MALDEEQVSRVRRFFSSRSDVTERKLNGTLAFMVDGSMACALREDGLLLRCKVNEHPGGPHVKPARMGSRIMSGFVLVQAAGLRTETALATWLQRGVEVARTAIPSKRKRAGRTAR